MLSCAAAALLAGFGLTATVSPAASQDMSMPMSPRAAGSEAVPPYVMPPVKEDPNPLVIQGPAGEIFRFVRTGASTCGRYLMAKAMIPAGAGPLPHIHHWTDEFFIAPDGGFTLFLGAGSYPSLALEPGRTAPKDHISLIATKPGDVFYGPRFMTHGVINNTQAPHELIFIWMPDRPENSILPYFKSVGKTLSSPDNPPPIDPILKIRFVTEAPRFGINQSSDFFQYVQDTDSDGRAMDPERNKQLTDMLTSVGDGTHCPTP